MMGQANRPQKKSPGMLLGCLFPIALLIGLITLVSFLAPTFNMGDQLGLVILGVFIVVLLVTGYMWFGPKDLLVTTAVLVGILGACFLLCTVLFMLNRTGTTTVGG